MKLVRRSKGWTHNTTLRWSVVFLLILLTACLPEPPSPTPVPPTETPTITPTTTATIIWFPPTATQTFVPTHIVQPTQDLRPDHGAAIFTDPFTDQTQWQTRQSTVGNIAYGEGELTLAVSEPHGTLVSLRKGPQLDNFYLEINATPNLCRDADSYGLLLRANSAQDFYRLMVSCSGQVRMERYKSAYTTPLQNWVNSGQLFSGGMEKVKLGVWAADTELRVFVNDVFQFTVKDPVFSTGMVGIYARSAGDTPLTVSFSDLVVYRIDSNQIRPLPSQTPIPSITPRPTSTRRPTPTTKP